MTAPDDTTDQPPDQPQTTGAPDEADFDATEAALALAIAAVILAWLLPGPATLMPDLEQAWQDQMTSALGFTVQQYIQRTAADLASSIDAPSAQTAAADAVTAVYPKVLTQIQQWSDETYHNLMTRDIAAGDLAEQVDTAATNLARGVASYARSETGIQTAGRLGAVWAIWKTRHDDRVRNTHRGLDGNKVPYGGTFVTDTGALIRFPGDPEAPIEETAGCRCHLTYRLRPKDTSYGEV